MTKKRRILLPIVLSFFVVIGAWFFTYQPRQKSSPQIKPIEKPSHEIEQLGTYEGTLPCADCSGLQTRLTLTINKTTQKPAEYILEEIYEGKNVEPFTTTGIWAITKGTPFNPDAIVYVLSPDKPSGQTYYLKLSDNTLQLLNNGKNKIKSPFPLILTQIAK